MSRKRDRWYVVVLDDRKEFALHVWRYLNRSLGIGTAPAGSSREIWMPEHKVLPFLDGVNQFCWIRADDHWKSKLDPLLKQLEQDWKLLAIVDVFGKQSYDPGLVLEHLKNWEDRAECWLVSAYQVGPSVEGVSEVRSKSRSTLNEIRQLLYPQERGTPPGSSDSLGAKHVLITGAGFEIRNPRGGFGMLPTTILMERMGPPFHLLKKEEVVDENKKGTIYLRSNKQGFPIPANDRWKRVKSIQRAAEDGQLDRYWDILLAQELSFQVGELLEMENEEREEVTAKALLAERGMREAFRQSIQKHDWGHLNQSLAAAKIPWHAWFTTNYTRFADRAIALVAPESWRVISTAAEANTSIREDNWHLDIQNKYLFKLHGDIGHLHTMAIAGHDKDTFSPLSVPIDDLYQVYAAAERFLRYSLDLRNPVPVVWHIVGHAMGDRRLVNLIRHACAQVKGKHLFLIADLAPAKPRKNVNQSLLKEPLDFEPRVEERTLVAEEYLERLADAGLNPSSDVEELASWFKDLPLGAEEAVSPSRPE